MQAMQAGDAEKDVDGVRWEQRKARNAGCDHLQSQQSKYSFLRMRKRIH